MKKIICALLLLLAVNSWAECENVSIVVGQFSGYVMATSEAVQTACPNRVCDYDCNACESAYQTGGWYYTNITKTNVTCDNSFGAGCGGKWCGYQSGNCRAALRCRNKCEADSVANYASCIAQGNRWENCQCVEVTSADSLLYVCNDSQTPDGTSYQYKLYAINMHFESGTATTACGVSASLVGGDGYKQHCPVVRSGSGTCQSNGLGNVPPQECSDPSCKDDPLPKADCYAVVGSKCYMKDIYSGNTFSCECDGSCQQAIVNMVSGNCRNPYPPPSSSGSGGDPSSSGSGGDSSGSGGDSSGSGGDPSSSGSGSEGGSSGSGSGIYTEQLNQIIANTQGIFNNTSDISQWTQTTMNNTTDIKNNLSDIGIDVSHIRSHTQGIESNTGSINSKLSTTNSLLQSLNNKNWSPEINVNPPEVNVNVGGDTTIVNVAGDTIIVNADTAKSGAAILDFLRETFNGLNFGSDYSENDTAGMGDSLSRSMRRLDSVSGVGVPNMRDSIPRAVTGVRGALHGLRDSINNSPYNDSVVVWQNQLLNNGVLSGGGANDCPEPLRRNFTWDFGSKLGVIQLGSFRYICEDIFGLGITFWGLARMLLRCMVSIACMLWIYRTVVGVEGGNNEED